MVIGGYNVEQGLLSDVEIYSPTGKCSEMKVAPIPSPRSGYCNIKAWEISILIENTSGEVNMNKQVKLKLVQSTL